MIGFGLLSTAYTLVVYALIVNFAPMRVANIFLNPIGVAKGLQYIQSVEMEKEMIQSKENFKKAITTKNSEIFDASAPYIGNKDAKVEVVVFTDYRCGYCKAFNDVMDKILSNPGYKNKVKFIVREYPILGQISALAAVGAFEAFAQSPEKYHKFHSMMYKLTLSSKKDVIDGARKAGVVVTLREDQSIKDKISNNIALGSEIGIRGTPAIIVGEELIGGFVGENELKAMIDKQLSK